MVAAFISEPAVIFREPPLVDMLPIPIVVPACKFMLPEEVVIVPVEALVAEVREIPPDEYVCKFPVVAVPPDWIVMEPPLVSLTLPMVSVPAVPHGQLPGPICCSPPELYACNVMEPLVEDMFMLCKLRLPPADVFPFIVTVAFDVFMVPVAPAAIVIAPLA